MTPVTQSSSMSLMSLQLSERDRAGVGMTSSGEVSGPWRSKVTGSRSLCGSGLQKIQKYILFKLYVIGPDNL